MSPDRDRSHILCGIVRTMNEIFVRLYFTFSRHACPVHIEGETSFDLSASPRDGEINWGMDKEEG